MAAPSARSFVKPWAADPPPVAGRHLLLCPPSYPPEPGGSARLFHSLAACWVAAGGRATVWTMDELGHGERFEEAAVQVRRFRRRRWTARPVPARALGGLARVLPARFGALLGFPHQASPGLLRFLQSTRSRAEGPFDLLLAGVLPHVHLLAPALRFARRQRIPAIVVPLLHAGLLDAEPMRRVAGIGAAPALCAAQRVVALTEAERGPLLRLGVPADRIVVLGAAIDDRPSADAGPFRRRHGLHGPYALQAGGLSSDKGTLSLIDAHATWLRADAAATLALVGRTDAAVRTRLAGLDDAQRRRIVLQESPSDEDLASALAGATVLVHPTRADAYSLLVLEAWRAGVPVIVAAAGGPGRLVQHDRDGVIVPPGDPAALADAILELCRDPARATALAAAGRERWRREGRWTTVFPRWQRLILDVMDGPS